MLSLQKFVLTRCAGCRLNSVGGAHARFEVTSTGHAAGHAFLGFGGRVAFGATDDATHAFAFEAGKADGDFVTEEDVENGVAGFGCEGLIIEGQVFLVNPRVGARGFVSFEI